MKVKMLHIRSSKKVLQMSKDYLEYSLHELPNLLALEIRQNMLWDKNKKLWPEAVEKFTKSIATSLPSYCLIF